MSQPGWILVEVAGAAFAIAIASVREVMPTPDVSRVPMAPGFVAGVVSVRRDVIPVVDLGLRAAGTAARRPGRMVVVATPDDENERVGLLVDEVTGLLESGASPPDGTTVLDLAAVLDVDGAVDAERI